MGPNATKNRFFAARTAFGSRRRGVLTVDVIGLLGPASAKPQNAGD
jgi:hypothetical protein